MLVVSRRARLATGGSVDGEGGVRGVGGASTDGEGFAGGLTVGGCSDIAWTKVNTASVVAPFARAALWSLVDEQGLAGSAPQKPVITTESKIR